MHSFLFELHYPHPPPSLPSNPGPDSDLVDPKSGSGLDPKDP